MELSPAFAAGPELVVPAECMRSLTELFVLQRDELRVVQRSGPVRLAATLTQLGPQPKPELQLYSLALVLDPSPSPHTLTCLANPTLDLTTAWREHREPQGTPSNSNPDPSPNSNPHPSPSPHPNPNPDSSPNPNPIPLHQSSYYAYGKLSPHGVRAPATARYMHMCSDAMAPATGLYSRVLGRS